MDGECALMGLILTQRDRAQTKGSAGRWKRKSVHIEAQRKGGMQAARWRGQGSGRERRRMRVSSLVFGASCSENAWETNLCSQSSASFHLRNSHLHLE